MFVLVQEAALAIDPKPFLGDRCYDLLQHMLNCEERLAADPSGLAQRMADLLGLDGGRVRYWLFARQELRLLRCLDYLRITSQQHVLVTGAPGSC